MPTPMPWKSMGTMASADPTAPLQPRAQRRVSWGWRVLWRGKRGCGQDVGWQQGWDGRGRGQGQGAMCCTLRGSVSSTAHRGTADLTNMVSPAAFLGDN